MTSRRFARAVLLVAAVLALGGCTAAPEPAVTPSSAARSSAQPSSPAPPSAAPSATPSAAPSGSPDPSASALTAATERYLGFVQQFSPALAATDPQVVLALGGAVCAGLEAGEDPGAIAVAIGDDPRASDLEASDAAVVIGAAVATLCPQYRDALQG